MKWAGLGPYRLAILAACFLLADSSAASASDFGTYAMAHTSLQSGSSTLSEDGGEGDTAAMTSLANALGDAQATAILTGVSVLPELGVFADPLQAGGRTWGRAIGQMAYRFGGDVPTSLTLDLTLEGEGTGAPFPHNYVQSNVAVILGDDLSFFTSGIETLIYEVVPLSPALQLLGKAELDLPMNMGRQVVTSSIPITLSPGDRFYVWADLFGYASAGSGAVNALDTFSARFSDATNIIPIPEPSSAALIAGIIFVIGRRWRSTS